MTKNPQIILLFSGKRKSGKDFITENIYKKLGEDLCEIIHISQPIKAHWAKHKTLDLEKLLSNGEYKENYRKEMIEWSEQVRAEDYGYFCREACTAISKPICIVSDVRRKTDLKWFNEQYGSKIKTVRIEADNNIREARGWIFTKGIDDVASECDLDDYGKWDIVLTNNNAIEVEKLIVPILDQVKKYIEMQ